MDTLNPEALAKCGDSEKDARDGVQPVTEGMIYAYVEHPGTLPPHAARPFAGWLADNWNEFNEKGDRTNGAVIEAALADWRGEGWAAQSSLD